MLFGQLECFLMVARVGSTSRAAEELVLAVGKGRAFAGRRDVGLEKLGGERLILFDRASTRESGASRPATSYG